MATVIDAALRDQLLDRRHRLENFVEVLGMNQPKISRHLAYLRRAGVVAARREGKWMHYRIATPEDTRAAQVFSEVMSWLREDREMQKDLARLQNFCCAPRPPVRLKGAPRPAHIPV